MSVEILDLPAPPADARIAYGTGTWQYGDLRLPAGAPPYPVVAFLHGGFWRARYDLAHAGHLCAALAAEGFATWNIEYRRIGHQGGGWPGTFLDVAGAFEHLRALGLRYPLDLARVVVAGHSAGGQLALWVAARERVPAGDALHTRTTLRPCLAVSLAGVVDLRAAWAQQLGQGVVEQFMGATPGEASARYVGASPAELVPLGIPQSLIHGTLDETVPFSLSAGYVEAARTLGDAADLVPLRDMGHFEPVDPRSAAWPFVLGAIRSRLA